MPARNHLKQSDLVESLDPTVEGGGWRRKVH